MTFLSLVSPKYLIKDGGLLFALKKKKKKSVLLRAIYVLSR